jgi:hypothetical protein
MAATLSTTEIAPILKELYPDGLDEQLIYKNHALLGMMTHKRNFGGRQMHVPIRYGKPQGRSHVFATAQTNAYTSVYKGFDVTRVSDYGVAKITGEAVDLAKSGDESIFIDDLQAEMDGALSTLGDNHGKEVYRSTYGTRGQISSVSGGVITLTNAEDVYFFEVGQVIGASPNSDTTSPRSGTGAVSAIDEDAGTVTYTGTITSVAANDYVFVSGDEAAAMAGLDSWVPSTAPTGGDSFYGVDRSVSTRLSGIRFSGATYGYEEVFIRAHARAARSACRPDYYFINPTDLANFETALSGQREVVDSKEYDMGFEMIRAYGVKLIPDADCPRGTAWGLDMQSYFWATLGDAPRVINEDGLELLRASTSDAYELRVVSRGNCISDAPGMLMRITLPT